VGRLSVQDDYKIGWLLKQNIGLIQTKFQWTASMVAVAVLLQLTSGPVDSFAGTPVDFQYINGDLARNAGQSLGLYRFDVSLTRVIKIPKWESASLELKMDVFNVFNHPLFIFNNSFDTLNLLLLPPLTANGAPNPNFNCTASCLNPFTGLYLGANGQPLTLAKFQRATYSAARNFMGLGGLS
jgi:hypothetical protein